MWLTFARRAKDVLVVTLSSRLLGSCSCRGWRSWLRLVAGDALVLRRRLQTRAGERVQLRVMLTEGESGAGVGGQLCAGV